MLCPTQLIDEPLAMATQGGTPTTKQKSVHVIEYYLENSLFSLRWLLVPLYVGLGMLLILFSVYFFRELSRLFAHAATGEEVDLILGALPDRDGQVASLDFERSSSARFYF